MTEEKMVEDIIGCIRAAGIDVVTDRSAMDSILGDSLEGAYRSEMLQKYVITYAEGNRVSNWVVASSIRHRLLCSRLSSLRMSWSILRESSNSPRMNDSSTVISSISEVKVV